MRAGRQLKILSTLAVAGFLMLGFGHACSQFTADGSGTLGIGSLGEDRILLNAKTVSTVYARQAMDSMASCLGISEPSQASLRTYQNVRQSISEFGSAKDLTAPMLMGLTSLAGDLCRDMYEQESQLATEERQILQDIDLQAQSLVSNEEELILARMARSCWQRDITGSELGAIAQAMSEIGDLRKSVIFACTAVLAAFDSVNF